MLIIYIYIYIKSKRDQAIATFKRYDRNNNGKMDVSELKEALKTVFNLDVISDDKILVIIILKLFKSLIK
jgi:Ca2+-binding EF-hand superfamily protein